MSVASVMLERTKEARDAQSASAKAFVSKDYPRILKSIEKAAGEGKSYIDLWQQDLVNYDNTEQGQLWNRLEADGFILNDHHGLKFVSWREDA